MRSQRIERLSTILMILVAAFGAFWFIHYNYRILPHIFIKNWAEFNGVDDTLEITALMRAYAFLLYLPIYIVAMTAIYFALKLLNFYRKSIIFDLRPAHQLVGLGLSLVGIALVDTYISCFEWPFLTQWNVDGGANVRYFYDPGDITIALSGLGFCLVGWITREAILIKEEVESFV